jgi:hypothetical protein
VRLNRNSSFYELGEKTCCFFPTQLMEMKLEGNLNDIECKKYLKKKCMMHVPNKHQNRDQ